MSKRIRNLIAVTCFLAVAMTGAAPKAFAFDGLGGASSGGKHWVEM